MRWGKKARKPKSFPFARDFWAPAFRLGKGVARSGQLAPAQPYAPSRPHRLARMHLSRPVRVTLASSTATGSRPGPPQSLCSSGFSRPRTARASSSLSLSPRSPRRSLSRACLSGECHCCRYRCSQGDPTLVCRDRPPARARPPRGEWLPRLPTFLGNLTSLSERSCPPDRPQRVILGLLHYRGA